MSADSAKAMADYQRAASRAHHEKRIVWLESDSPAWAHGEKVSLWDKSKMLIASRNWLQEGVSINDCQCEPRCHEQEPTNG